MRFFPAALLLSLSLATGGFAQEAPAAAPAESETPKDAAKVSGKDTAKKTGGVAEKKKNAAAEAAGGMRGMGGGNGSGKKPFPLHILMDVAQSVGSGSLYGFNKDTTEKDYEISNDTANFQPFNAYTATTLFLMPMANFKGFNFSTSMWYVFEQTLADNATGRNLAFGDPLTRISYPIRLSDLNLMINPSMGFTLPLSYRSGYVGRLSAMAGTTANWSWKGLILSGNLNLQYNYDNPSLSRGDKEARDFNDRSFGPTSAHLIDLRMGQDERSVIGNTGGASASTRIGATYIFLDVFSVSGTAIFRTNLLNPLANDEFTAEGAEGGTTPMMGLFNTTSTFFLSGNYQILDWLGLYVQYSAVQRLLAGSGRGYEPLDYDEYQTGSKTTDYAPSAVFFDLVSGSQNSMSVAAGMTLFF